MLVSESLFSIFTFFGIQEGIRILLVLDARTIRSGISLIILIKVENRLISF